MQKMKAAVMYGLNDIRVEQVDKAKCDEDGILVKIEAVGLCGSDIRNFSSGVRYGNYPCILGHEQAGTIAEIGPKVKRDFKVGDRVYISPLSKKDSGGDWDPASGGFAEYLALSEWNIENSNILSIPEGLKFEAATLAEPLSAVYACQDAIDVKIGQTVVILGAGPIGCMHSELAKMRGASKVIMIDLAEERLKMALNFGVDNIINGAVLDPVEEVKNLTGGLGANHVICANSTTKAQQQAVFMCARRGIVTLFGGVPKGSLVEIDTNRIHYASMWLYGHAGYSGQENRKAFELICSGQFDAEKYISRIMPLDDINEAIELVKTNKVIKIVFNP
ncbi:MAG: zinc-binding dehydrogenase [Pelolinea sp.]|nr:zinc-binding dehydrogenase [Pelolinea sp.]